MALRNWVPRHQHLAGNLVGRDFCVGDIHGQFHLLRDKLQQVAFDPARDRLFSVGDLCDRGLYSHEIEKWLDNPWFYPVLGNHEWMLLCYVERLCEAQSYARNGGQWFIALDGEHQQRIARRIRQLPLAITIGDEPASRTGIVHAEVPAANWSQLVTDLEQGTLSDEALNICLWSRRRLLRVDGCRISGVGQVLHGHTPLPDMVRLGNAVYLDTQAYADGGHLTLYRISS